MTWDLGTYMMTLNMYEHEYNYTTHYNHLNDTKLRVPFTKRNAENAFYKR